MPTANEKMIKTCEVAMAGITFSRMSNEFPPKGRSDDNHFCCFCGEDCIGNARCSDRYLMANGSFHGDNSAVSMVYYCDDCGWDEFDFKMIYFTDRGLFFIDVAGFRMNTH